MIPSLKRRDTLLSCGLVLGLLVVGCNRQVPDKDVVAKVNGYKILRSELDKNYNSLTAGIPRKPSPAEEQVVRLNIVRQTIERHLQLQRAEKLGVAATEDEVNDKIKQTKAPYTKEEFEKRLKDMAMTEDDFKQEIRRGLTIEKLRNKEISSKVVIADADIQDYYDRHKSEFNLTEPQYQVAHIFVGNRPGSQPSPTAGKAQNEAQAQAKIRMIHGRLESGEDFAQLAARYSEDPDSARNGGELGSSPESQLKSTDAATREAILKLKPGQYTNPIPVIDPQSHRPIGYRIVRLIAKEAAGQRELSDPNVQQWIRNQLRDQRQKLLQAAYEAVLYDGAEIRDYYAQNILNDAGKK